MHEKGLQRQKGVGPLVGSQERRALLVPLINRLQSACQPLVLFLHSVYIGFCLFVLLEKRSGDASSMLWGVRGTFVSLANCSVGVPSCPAPPRRPAVRPDPTRPWYVRILDSTGRRRHTGQQPGTKSGRGPADKSDVNRGSTIGFVPLSVYIGFPLFVLLGNRSKQLSTMLGGAKDGCLLGEPICRRPGLPGPAPPRRPAVRRPDPTCPWYVRVLDSTNFNLLNHFVVLNFINGKYTPCTELRKTRRIRSGQTASSNIRLTVEYGPA